VFNIQGNSIWLNGINLPWIKWSDFDDPWGTNNYNHADFDSTFKKYAANGINSVRVWVHCKSEGSPILDSNAYVTGVCDEFWTNFGDMLNLANKYDLWIMPALFSFDMIEEDRILNKYLYNTAENFQLFVESQERTQSYIDNFLIEMINKFDTCSRLFAWEICNEPEWMWTNEGGPLAINDIIRMHAQIAAAFHQFGTKPVTTGATSLKWCSNRDYHFWNDSIMQAHFNDTNAYLDFYQVHYYDWMDPWYIPWDDSPAYWGLDDKKVIIGECPGNGGLNFTTEQMYTQAFDLGYAGVFAWSDHANDGIASFNDIKPATNLMDSLYPEYIRDVEFIPLFLASTTIGVNPLIVNFDATSTVVKDTNITRFLWSFGDGYHDTGTVVSHTFKDTGSFITELMVIASGDTGIARKTITVLDASSPPVAEFDVSPQAGTAPLKTTFNASNSGIPNNEPLTYTWKFGNGETDTGKIVNYEYTLPGTYTAKLIVSHPENGSDSTTKTITIYDPAIMGDLELQFRDEGSTNQKIYVTYNIKNNDSNSVPLEELSIRYWYTNDQDHQQAFECYYANIGSNKITGSFGALSSAYEQADYYFEVGFTSNADDLGANSETGEIQVAVHNADWESDYDHSNDYSAKLDMYTLGQWKNVTLYRNDTLISGIEPSILTNFALKDTKSNNIKLFPNPATNFVNIIGNKTHHIQILNDLGEIVASKYISDGQIDVSNLRNGVYWLIIENKKGKITKQFIIHK
jgi:PKD repeat protein